MRGPEKSVIRVRPAAGAEGMAVIRRVVLNKGRRKRAKRDRNAPEGVPPGRRGHPVVKRVIPQLRQVQPQARSISRPSIHRDPRSRKTTLV